MSEIRIERRDGAQRWGGIVAVLTTLLGSALLAACGNDGVAPSGAQSTPLAKAAAARKNAKSKAAESVESEAAPGEEQMAVALGTSKTSAAVDLRYDFVARPAAGQPIVIELSFAPRVAADSLEVEVTGMAGLTLADSGTAKFAPVQAGERYKTRLLVSAAADGLYYLDVIARMVNKVQTDARTFSIPVVVGSTPAARTVAPASDAAGQPIESLPAVETTQAD